MCRVPSVSPELCTRFYATWCLVWGSLFGFGYSFVLLADLLEVESAGRNDLLQRTIRAVIAGLGFSYLLAGILLTLGIKYNKPFVFKCGKLLCLIFAICSLPTVIFPVVHFCSVSCLCQYMKDVWNIS
ncbi:uncharacterized protein LOC26526931 [Drosophila erecta]|uniref:Uncharacterized protein n=1 Tax=Drosophila erecta TaxID=7220 RepID=A0A0Q5VLT3_DROER|nr:uncharacterized protein LOC26526931 [Drosophila erecta]KQS62321.1 uncharacterized protein Dere_GG27107 [Drosophila erecta]